MRRFVRHIIIFLLPIVLLFCLMEYGLRRIPKNYSYKNDWLECNISTIKILTLGSSHGYYGINPQYFDKKAYNAANVSQSLKYDAFIVDKFIPRADSLEYVILPISFGSLTSSMEEGDEWWRVKGYCIYFDCPYHKMDINYRTEIFGVSFYNQIKRLTSYYIQGENEIGCDTLGFGQGCLKVKRPKANWTSNGKSRAQLHSMDHGNNERNIVENQKCIEDVITRCEEHNTKLLMITTPTWRTYYENIDTAQYNMMIAYCDSIANVYDHVRYVNYFKDERFSEDDFFDSDHLCDEGAMKFTKLLSEELQGF